MKPLFFVRSRHGDCGSNVMFHNKNGGGYGTDLNSLQLFTMEEAQRHVDQSIRSLPLLASKVRELAVLHIDMQFLNKLQGTPSHPGDECVVQIKRRFDGNDIAFSSTVGDTFDFRKATVMSYEDALRYCDERHAIWLKSYMIMLARPTFQAENISTRTMITGPGIKYKKPRKSRATSGKKRGNCPACGSITWDCNPYENAYCHNHKWD